VSRDEALAAVRARIARYERTGDPDIVLHTTAILELADLGRFRSTARRGQPDLEVCRAAGWLFWYRYVELGKNNDPRTEANLASALAYLAPVYQDGPLAVPQPAEGRLLAQGVRSPTGLIKGSRALRRATRELQRAVETGDRARLDRAIAALRRALDKSQDGGDQASASFSLGLALLQRSVDDGDTLVLDETITSLRRAGTDPRVRRRAAAILGYACYLRFEHTASHADLDEAISLLRTGVLELPPGDPISDDRYDLLAEALRSRYRLTFDLDVLNEAISALRLAAQFTQDRRDASGRLARLSLLLRQRYEDTHDRDSLEEAVATGRQAIAAAEESAKRLNGSFALAGALVRRFQDAGVLADLDEAISLYRRIGDGFPDDHPSRAQAMGDLAAALVERYRLERRYSGTTADSAPLDEAIALFRQALAGTPDRERQAPVLTNLGAAMEERYDRTNDSDLLDQIVDIFARAAAATGTADQLHALRDYGISLFRRYRVNDEARDLRAAVNAARAAATADAGTPSDRLAAMIDWAQWAARAGLWDEATEGYLHLVRLLPRLAPAHLRRSDQERNLEGVFALTSDGAAAAVNAGRVDTAVELLEQGRAILLSAALDLDHDLAGLWTAAPDLAEEYLALRDALGSTVDSHARRRVPDADRRYRLTDRWEHLLSTIRRLPGFERFLQPPRLAELLPAAADGPVIIVNVSRYRCDALVVERTQARLVPLPDLDSGDLSDRARLFTDALRVTARAGTGLLDRLTAQDAVRHTLEWLWDTVTGPVLSALGITAPPAGDQPRPRVWWSPTGALTLLPLHAAGHHTGGGPTVLDRVVSSYVPTVRALMYARRRTRGLRRGPLLMVAMPQTPGHSDLNAAHTEGIRIAGRWPGLPPLTGAQATRETVLDMLPRCGWVHFACHAYSDPVAPSTSHLLLHDQPLMVSDMSRLRLPSAELAYLSACSTARTTTTLAGEAIHLGSAFQRAGFPHVIATLWEVGDEAAAHIADRFYAHLNPDEQPTSAEIAVALHAAVRHTRDAYPWLPTMWAAHVHTGP